MANSQSVGQVSLFSYEYFRIQVHLQHQVLAISAVFEVF